jgi:S1-C subfamily serine protease
LTAGLYVINGAGAGRTLALSREPILIGRDPEADLRFDAQKDLEVSARHATLTRHGDQWVLRDLGSRNGTFLNGRSVNTPTVVRAGDRITFGRFGPLVEFRIDGASAPAVATAPLASTAAAPTYRPDANSPTARIRVAVARQTRGLRTLAVVLGLLLAGTVGTLFYLDGRQRNAWERERLELSARIDSILAASDLTIRALEGQVGGLAEALEDSKVLVREAHFQLESAADRGENNRLPALQRELQSATTLLARQQSVAALDFHAIERDNRRAIALIYSESVSGEISTATAFAVRADATLLTSRHVLVGDDGTRARRIAVQFSGSEQVWPAHVVLISPDADLAVIRVDNILGTVPTVRSLNLRPDTVGPGAAVAVLGYPLGVDADHSDGSRSARLAQPVLAAGILGKGNAQRLEIQAYGAPGASGSPIFDANGEVLAVLFGGWRDGARQTLVAVPASVASRLLDSIR